MSLTASEFLKELSVPKTETPTLNSIIESVLKDAHEPKQISDIKMDNTIKIKHRAAKDSVVSFRGLDVHFNKEGIAELPATLKDEVQAEMNYRPGLMSFVEEISNTITIDQLLEKAREEIQPELDKLETSEPEEEDIQVSKKGRKGKVKDGQS